MSALAFSGIGKSFFGVPVLSDITLELGGGRILGLVGQNGAGKSTLMNILGGVIGPDGGAMTIEGVAYAPANPREAEVAGIAFIHQELNLFSNLTIAENIFLTDLPRRRGGLVDRRTLRRRAAGLLKEIDLAVSPDTSVERLSPGERQLVEIAKAVHLDARIVIFDEPTTSLTPRETARLFRLMRRLRDSGKTVIFISHVLADVLSLADDVAVLRDGRLVGSGRAKDFSIGRMIELMLGREIAQLYPAYASHVRDDVLLETRGLSLRGAVHNVSLSLRAGEVLGVFGLMGSGRTELMRILFGLDRFHGGSLIVRGKAVSAMTPRRAIGSGMAFITENRREEGLMMNAAIAENIALASLGRLGAELPGFIDQRRLVASAADLVAKLQLKAGDLQRQTAKSLSGGNQQKVVIAKWILTEPLIFLLDEPTRGIDVAAKYESYAIVQRLASQGAGILFISSEIEEVMAMCDRILVMSTGEIVASFERAAFDKEAILRAAFRQGEQAA